MDPATPLIPAALALDPDAFRQIAGRPDGLRFALLLLTAAGASQGMGQSVALFANRVRPRRFVGSLLLGALSFAASAALYGLALAATATLLFDRPASGIEVIRLVGLASAPRLFGVLILTPYFGTAIGAVLTGWSVLALAVGARAVLGLGLVEVSVAL
ncbi:MAG: hypothetical protein WD336_07270, partial [Trueperaceae bacterium]